MKVMKIALAVMLTTASTLIHATTFEERVRLGLEAEQKYRHGDHMFGSTVDQLAEHMRACIAASPNHQIKSFTLVADYTQAGRAINVEVRPAVSLTTCFAEKFGRTQFPKFPRDIGRSSLPFAHEFRD
jgi:hypothetical protein